MSNDFEEKVNLLIDSIGSGYKRKYKNIKFKLSNKAQLALPENSQEINNTNSLNDLLKHNNNQNEIKIENNSHEAISVSSDDESEPMEISTTQENVILQNTPALTNSQSELNNSALSNNISTSPMNAPNQPPNQPTQLPQSVPIIPTNIQTNSFSQPNIPMIHQNLSYYLPQYYHSLLNQKLELNPALTQSDLPIMPQNPQVPLTAEQQRALYMYASQQQLLQELQKQQLQVQEQQQLQMQERQQLQIQEQQQLQIQEQQQLQIQKQQPLQIQEQQTLQVQQPQSIQSSEILSNTGNLINSEQSTNTLENSGNLNMENSNHKSRIITLEFSDSDDDDNPRINIIDNSSKKINTEMTFKYPSEEDDSSNKSSDVQVISKISNVSRNTTKNKYTFAYPEDISSPNQNENEVDDYINSSRKNYAYSDDFKTSYENRKRKRGSQYNYRYPNNYFSNNRYN